MNSGIFYFLSIGLDGALLDGGSLVRNMAG
jgi:hypothetical protein